MTSKNEDTMKKPLVQMTREELIQEVKALREDCKRYVKSMNFHIKQASDLRREDWNARRLQK
jgi:hypothetical protein